MALKVDYFVWSTQRQERKGDLQTFLDTHPDIKILAMAQVGAVGWDRTTIIYDDGKPADDKPES